MGVRVGEFLQSTAVKTGARPRLSMRGVGASYKVRNQLLEQCRVDAGKEAGKLGRLVACAFADQD